MITKFAVTNYRGFLERIELDLSNPRDYAFNTYAVHCGIVKDAIIYGPNGSGKTNIGLALFDIVNHLSQKWKKTDYYTNFISAGSNNPKVSFEYSFKFGKDFLQYNYSKNRRGDLAEESLHVNGKMVFDKTELEFHVNETEFKLPPAALKQISANANAVSLVNYLLSSFPLPKNHYLIKLRDFVSSMLWFRCLEEREFIGLETGVYLLDEYIITNDLLDDFSAFLGKVSSQHFDFATPRTGDRVILCEYNGELIPFNTIASTGTRSLTLLYFWVKHLSKASFVFIDEFDAFYHFKLSYEVCKLLFKNDCQILLSSHNTYLMSNDLLRPDCNFIIADNVIKPLCETTDKELRFAHNIEKIYRGMEIG